MKREDFWSDDPNGEVRYENCVIVDGCAPSEGRAIAKQLNDVIAKARQAERPIERVKKRLGKMTAKEQRLVLLIRYAVMYALDHES